jgi:hypothetical protein
VHFALVEGAYGLSSRTSPVPPHVGHSIMICSGTAGPGELSSDGTFPVPPQSGQGIVLGSSSIIEITFGAGIAAKNLAPCLSRHADCFKHLHNPAAPVTVPARHVSERMLVGGHVAHAPLHREPCGGFALAPLVTQHSKMRSGMASAGAASTAVGLRRHRFLAPPRSGFGPFRYGQP